MLQKSSWHACCWKAFRCRNAATNWQFPAPKAGVVYRRFSKRLAFAAARPCSRCSDENSAWLKLANGPVNSWNRGPQRIVPIEPRPQGERAVFVLSAAVFVPFEKRSGDACLFESAYTSRQQSQAGSALARRAPALGPSRSRGAETRHASRTDRPAPASQCPVDWSQRILAEALDTLNLAVLATSASGQLLFANRPAQQILRTRDGLQLTPQGALETSRPTGRASLLEMIAAVGLHAPSETSVPDSPLLIVKRPMGRRPLTLVIQALHTSPPSVDPAAASVVVFAADPDRRLGAAEAALRQLHGITSREARLAGLLMEGHTLEDCCQDLSIQTSTARMHLGSLFSKTGTQRQSQLVAHLLSSLGLLRNPVASACESLPGLLASASPRIERMNVGGIAPGFAVLDCLEVGVAVVDASRQLRFVNRVAQRFMAECIGLPGHG